MRWTCWRSRPTARSTAIDHNDKMYRDTDQKYNAIVDEIHEVHRKGRPADPFILADALGRASPDRGTAQGEDTSKLDEAIRQFNKAEFGDKQVIRFMLETYDDAMGELAPRASRARGHDQRRELREALASARTAVRH